MLMGRVEAENFHLTLMSLLTMVNAGLVVAGIYGVMSFTVTNQTPEIGQRLASGATTREVMTLIVRHAMKLAVQGTVIGLGVALLLARWIKVALFGVEASDSLTFVGVAVVLSARAFVTTYLLLRRESALQPVRRK
jgi:ABC-type lipoprotein release transport system permease subunit